jgi:3',5'-cyclic AMP phosphodiesterase CpdA
MRRRRFLQSIAGASTILPAVAADEVPLLRFGLITDAQYADVDAEGERHYRASPEKLKRAVEVLRDARLEFTLHLGDFIDRGFAGFGTLLPILEGLGHPVRHLLGNHDYDVTPAEKARVVATLGMPHDYYTFRSGKLRFVMLDTTSLSTYKHPDGSAAKAESEKVLAAAKAAGHPGAEPWNGGISPAQLDWLDRELTAADAAGERAILCGHHPLMPADFHQLWNHEAVLGVIDRHDCVAAWFNGHNHGGAFVERKGVPYVTFRSMLHHPENTAFSVVEVHADRIVITGHGRETSRVLALRTS